MFIFEKDSKLKKKNPFQAPQAAVQKVFLSGIGMRKPTTVW